MVPSLFSKENGNGSSAKYEAFKRSYFNRPDAFAVECIKWPKGQSLAPYQMEILANLPVRQRISARGPHGLGKSSTSAIALLWYALTRDGLDWKVATTASVWSQLIQYLWPEIHKWSRLINWYSVGRRPFDSNKEMFSLSLKLKTGQAFAVASDDPERIEGGHADYMFYIFDEAKIVPDPTWDSAEGAMSSGREKLWLSVSTPGDPVGRFYDIQMRAPGYEDWWVRHITLGEAVEAGRIDPDWADQRKLQWGKSSTMYINRVLGEFASSSEETVIPAEWVDEAMRRGEDRSGSPALSDKKLITHVGIDVARKGGDATVYFMRSGTVCYEPEMRGAQDTMVTAGEIIQLHNKHQNAIIIIDAIGMGAGVYDRVEEVLQINGKRSEDFLFAFIASASTEWTDVSELLKFRDLRSAAWWNMRQLLDPAYGYSVILPPNRDLRAELVAPKYESLSDGKIKIESKDDIRRRLGRSTNLADALIMSFWEEVYSVGMEFA